MGNPLPPTSGAERRQHLRVPRSVNALLHVGVMSLRGRLLDLSLGGARLRVQDGDACPAVGSVGLLELHLGETWRHARIRVVRCAFDEIAVRFHEVTSELGAAIEAEIAAGQRAQRRPPILVVDPSHDRRERVAETLRTAGCDPVLATTPLEAIDIVEKQGGSIRGMAVADSLTQTSADELCDYVSRSNPEIRLRRIAAGTSDVPLTADLEDEAEREAESTGVVRALRRAEGTQPAPFTAAGTEPGPLAPDGTSPVPLRPSAPQAIPVILDDDTLDTAMRDFALDTANDLSPLPKPRR